MVGPPTGQLPEAPFVQGHSVRCILGSRCNFFNRLWRCSRGESKKDGKAKHRNDQRIVNKTIKHSVVKLNVRTNLALSVTCPSAVGVRPTRAHQWELIRLSREEKG